MKIGVVVADFNKDMTHEMLRLVSEKAKADGHEVSVAHVAGVYDITLTLCTHCMSSQPSSSTYVCTYTWPMCPGSHQEATQIVR